MGIDDLQVARTADVFWRGLRAHAVVAYLIAGIARVQSGYSRRADVLAFLVLMGAAGTIYMTGRIRAILAPHRDAATGELPFERPPLRLADVIGLWTAPRDR